MKPLLIIVLLGGAKVELPLERYVAGVLAGEAGVFRSDEALRAMAVAARTYAVRERGRHASEGFDFCATTHCQRVDLQAVARRLEEAAAATEGELLWFQGSPAFTCYSRDCGGRTEDARAVWPALVAPYLKSHDDRYCAEDRWRWAGDGGQIAEALRRSRLRTPKVVEQISIAERTASGRTRTLLLSGSGDVVRISAGSFRFALGRELGWNTLQSDRYEIHGLEFQGRGSGHGVGLCQRGADQMGVAGRTWREILAFYYPGTEPGRTGRGISWQRLGGDAIALFTTRPGQDRAVLARAERALRTVSQSTGLAAPAGIEIRVYPTVEAFRNATGEPGWVAASTRGRRIDLQPSATTARTLRHELLHALVEAQAAPGVPLWFREGLVGLMADGHAEAVLAVKPLVSRYGLETVFGWLKTGLPPEARNSNSSQDARKSR
jgi:stage II sporulation protein D